MVMLVKNFTHVQFFCTKLKGRNSVGVKQKHVRNFRYQKNQSNQSKFYLKSVHFITIQHKLSRAFQTDMHNKIT